MISTSGFKDRFCDIIVAKRVLPASSTAKGDEKRGAEASAKAGCVIFLFLTNGGGGGEFFFWGRGGWVINPPTRPYPCHQMFTRLSAARTIGEPSGILNAFANFGQIRERPVHAIMRR